MTRDHLQQRLVTEAEQAGMVGQKWSASGYPTIFVFDVGEVAVDVERCEVLFTPRECAMSAQMVDQYVYRLGHIFGFMCEAEALLEHWQDKGDT